MVIGQRITSAPFSQETILQSLINVGANTTPATGTEQMDRRKSIGKSVRSVILRADLESRLVIGLSSAIQQLTENASDTLFCILVTPKKGDCATHMQEVLLKAFCFENDIYIIQVDSSEKLARQLNVTSCGSCVLVQRSPTNGENSATEELLIDFCEEFWDAPTQPVVHLPES